MIKFLTLNKTTWIGFLVALAASFMMAVNTHAQTPPATAAATPADEHEDAARKHGVTFPIAELGGCTDYSACRNFCEDPLNATACINYGKQKGFYKEESFEVNNKILETAKSVLGCDSKTACLNFCEVPANYDKCDSFAKGQGLVGGRVDDPSKTQVISRAREVLGCDSATGCQSLCSQEANRQKCSDFAKTVGLHGGEHKVGPGGCSSESTCKSFCSDPQNFQVCSGFTSVAGGQFKGPGGCDSEASCRAYCQSNEKACSSVFGGDPVDMCNRTPNCAWTGNTCQCGFYGETTETAQKAGEYAAFCQANPDKCKPGQPGVFDSSKQRQEFESFCTLNPDKCGAIPGGPGDYHDPATECARYGCSWTNNTCQCRSIGTYSPQPHPTNSAQPNYTPQPYPTSSPYTGGSSGTYNYTDSATACKNAGGSWTGSYCQMPGTNTTTTSSTPAPAPAQTSAPSQTSAPAPQPTEESQPQQQTTTQQTTTTESSGGTSGGSCPSGSYMKDGACVQGVQGISTVRSWLDRLFDRLFDLL